GPGDAAHRVLRHLLARAADRARDPHALGGGLCVSDAKLLTGPTQPVPPGHPDGMRARGCPAAQPGYRTGRARPAECDSVAGLELVAEPAHRDDVPRVARVGLDLGPEPL